MKDLRNVKSEYGYILRWINADEYYPGRYYLEDVNTNEQLEITDTNALDFIAKKTPSGFRANAFIYENYVKLFEILGIEKRVSKLQEMRKSKNLSQSKLSRISGVNLRTLQDYEQGRKDIDKAEALTVCKLAKALDCNVEDLLETPIERNHKFTDQEISDVLFYCYLLCRCVSPADAERYYNFDFDGAYSDTLREMSRVIHTNSSVDDFKSDELYGEIYKNILSDVRRYLKDK